MVPILRELRYNKSSAHLNQDILWGAFPTNGVGAFDMTGNPNWTRDELILALDVFFKNGRKQLPANHPEVIALSTLLNVLPIHAADNREINFRNTGSVSMKLGNFLRLDPERTGVGLSRGGELDKVIWDEFATNLPELARIADAIRKNIKQIVEQNKQLVYLQPDDSDEEFPEGRLLTRLHLRKERNRTIVKEKKRRVLAEFGKLLCEACDFDFAVVYGERGVGFAECHHTIPLADLEENHRTRLTDLAIVCANCHRILHRRSPLLSIAELRAIVKQRTQ